MLDDLDRRILRQLQADPTLGAAELAERCRMTQATCWRRVEKMQEAGVILGQETIIDWAALGYAVEVSLRVTLDKTQSRAFDEFLAAAREGARGDRDTNVSGPGRCAPVDHRQGHAPLPKPLPRPYPYAAPHRGYRSANAYLSGQIR